MDLFNSKLLRREYSCQGKIDLISILGSSDKIIVESGDVANVMVSYPECPGKHEFVLTEQDGTLTLERKPITSFLWAVWQPFIDNGIRVTVPGGFRGGLGIKSSSGRISVSEINPERVNLECSSGAVTVESKCRQSFGSYQTAERQCRRFPEGRQQKRRHTFRFLKDRRQYRSFDKQWCYQRNDHGQGERLFHYFAYDFGTQRTYQFPHG